MLVVRAANLGCGLIMLSGMKVDNEYGASKEADYG